MRRLVVLAALVLAMLPTGISEAGTTPKCFGKNVTILGTDGFDHLTGTEGTDVMHGLAGDDGLIAWLGITRPDRRDFICGGDGDDRMSPGVGSDFVDGGRGADQGDGFRGNDTLLGGSGPDQLNGAEGSDTVDGGPGNDLILNSIARQNDPNSDVYLGGDGNDWVRAGGSSSGFFGEDFISGGEGDDVLEGTAELHQAERPGFPDIIDGGPGWDICYADPDDTVIDCEDVRPPE